MQVSQRCQYALRALFELAKRRGAGAVNVAEIAAAQALPARFLETILQSLTKSGEVVSRRGMRGGYQLAVEPREISVGDVIRRFDGTMAPVRCAEGTGSRCCPLLNRCAFSNLWERARRAAEAVYDTTTLQDLIDDERSAADAPNSLTFFV
jgi:Rrf2 family transcriptional regulator, cysteine metabolism repressor